MATAAVAETVPGYEANNWWGILAPAKTPPDVVARLNTEINRILGSDEMKPRLVEQGGSRFTFLRTDFADYAGLTAALDGKAFDRIVHLGAQAGVVQRLPCHAHSRIGIA